MRVETDQYGNEYTIGYSNELKNFKPAEGQTHAVIPEGVTSIRRDVFNVCTGLTSVVIPEGVTSIGDSAFEGCTGLTEVVIPDSVANIGDSAFAYCDGLTIVTLPEGVTSIGESAFHACTDLTSVVIPDSVTSIGRGSFWKCTKLDCVYVNDASITRIAGLYAFKDILPVSFRRFCDTGLTIKDMSGDALIIPKDTGIFNNYRIRVERIKPGDYDSQEDLFRVMSKASSQLPAVIKLSEDSDDFLLAQRSYDGLYHLLKKASEKDVAKSEGVGIITINSKHYSPVKLLDDKATDLIYLYYDISEIGPVCINLEYFQKSIVGKAISTVGTGVSNLWRHIIGTESSGAGGGAAAPKRTPSDKVKPAADEVALKPEEPDAAPEDKTGVPRGP